MKRVLWIFLLLLALTGALAACGGSAAPEPAAPVETAPSGTNGAAGEAEAPSAAEPTVPQPTAEEPAAGESEAEAPAEEAAPAGDLIAGRPASGIDPDTGLEINPASVVPGVDFIVRGNIINSSLTPQDSPEFLVQAPSGTRYRIRAQPVSQIAYEDGTTLAPHQYRQGMLAQATVRQEEGAGATILVTSTDFTLLPNE